MHSLSFLSLCIFISSNVHIQQTKAAPQGTFIPTPPSPISTPTTSIPPATTKPPPPPPPPSTSAHRNNSPTPTPTARASTGQPLPTDSAASHTDDVENSDVVSTLNTGGTSTAIPSSASSAASESVSTFSDTASVIALGSPTFTDPTSATSNEELPSGPKAKLPNTVIIGSAIAGGGVLLLFLCVFLLLRRHRARSERQVTQVRSDERHDASRRSSWSAVDDRLLVVSGVFGADSSSSVDVTTIQSDISPIQPSLPGSLATSRSRTSIMLSFPQPEWNPQPLTPVRRTSFSITDETSSLNSALYRTPPSPREPLTPLRRTSFSRDSAASTPTLIPPEPLGLYHTNDFPAKSSPTTRLQPAKHFSLNKMQRLYDSELAHDLSFSPTPIEASNYHEREHTETQTRRQESDAGPIMHFLDRPPQYDDVFRPSAF